MSDDYSIDYQAIEQARVFTIIIASISVLFPLSVVIILIQRYNTLVRGKSLVHYVLCIAIADTMTAILLAFGYPYAGTVECSIQGFALWLFARFSWFYTDVLIMQLFSIVVFKQYFLNVKYMHCIVWSLNWLLQILPFTTGTTYGQDDDGIPLYACAIAGGKGKYDAAFWSEYTIFIEIIISFSLIILLSLVIVYFSLRTSTSDAYLGPRIKDSWSLIVLYPGAMFVAWIPSQICSLYINHIVYTGQELPANVIVEYNYLLAISALYGPLLSIIFYTKTIEARRAWLSNLRYISRMIIKSEVDNDNNDNHDNNDKEDDIRCSSIISIDDRLVSETNIRLSSLWKRSSDQSISVVNYIVNPLKNSVPVNDSSSRDTIASIRIPEA